MLHGWTSRWHLTRWATRLLAIERWGLPSRLIEYISHLYSNAYTVLDGKEDPVKITRGVLQGDPLSPFFFNICLDWALSAIPEERFLPIAAGSLSTH